MKKITIGSRGSDLALWQAHHVRKQLEELGHEIELKIIVTQGDAIQHLSFDKLEGKGFFTKEIELALLDGSIDLAVHSHKDLETTPPAGLVIAAVSEREDPSDLLLIRKEKADMAESWQVIDKGIIGTSSSRRKSQVVRYRPDLEIRDLRGNVPTRIQKLRDGQYDAILLAKAGVDRLQLDLSDFHVQVLDPTVFVPAPAQGVLALQIRETDTELAEILQALNHKDVAEKIAVERKVLNLLHGGCQLPLGVYSPSPGKVYVSHTDNWEDGANWFLYEFEETDDMAELIVEELLSGIPDDEDEE
jgi:hydroxymethylbilane synthase